MDINQNLSTEILNNFDRTSVIHQQDQKFEEIDLKEVEIVRTDDDFLIELHKMHGNKWNKISTHYVERDGLVVKNHFYSLLRKCLKKLNTYITLTRDSTNQSKLFRTNEWAKLLYLATLERYQISRTNIYENLLYALLNLHRYNLFKESSFQSLLDQNSFKGLENAKLDRMIQTLRGIKDFVLKQKENKKKTFNIKIQKKLRIKRKSSPKPSDQNKGIFQEINSKTSPSKTSNSNQQVLQTNPQSQRLRSLRH